MIGVELTIVAVAIAVGIEVTIIAAVTTVGVEVTIVATLTRIYNNGSSASSKNSKKTMEVFIDSRTKQNE